MGIEQTYNNVSLNQWKKVNSLLLSSKVAELEQQISQKMILLVQYIANMSLCCALCSVYKFDDEIHLSSGKVLRDQPHTYILVPKKNKK